MALSDWNMYKEIQIIGTTEWDLILGQQLHNHTYFQ